MITLLPALRVAQFCIIISVAESQDTQREILVRVIYKVTLIWDYGNKFRLVPRNFLKLYRNDSYISLHMWRKTLHHQSIL